MPPEAPGSIATWKWLLGVCIFKGCFWIADQPSFHHPLHHRPIRSTTRIGVAFGRVPKLASALNTGRTSRPKVLGWLNAPTTDAGFGYLAFFAHSGSATSPLLPLSGRSQTFVLKHSARVWMSGCDMIFLVILAPLQNEAV